MKNLLAVSLSLVGLASVGIGVGSAVYMNHINRADKSVVLEQSFSRKDFAEFDDVLNSNLKDFESFGVLNLSLHFDTNDELVCGFIDFCIGYQDGNYQLLQFNKNIGEDTSMLIPMSDKAKDSSMKEGYYSPDKVFDLVVLPTYQKDLLDYSFEYQVDHKGCDSISGNRKFYLIDDNKIVTEIDSLAEGEYLSLLRYSLNVSQTDYFYIAY